VAGGDAVGAPRCGGIEYVVDAACCESLRLEAKSRTAHAMLCRELAPGERGNSDFRTPINAHRAGFLVQRSWRRSGPRSP
jgi:hypothetical protein